MGRGGGEMSGQPGGAETVQEPVEQAQVHSAHELGMFLGQGVEGAVSENDLVAFGVWLVAVSLERVQRGDLRVLIAGGRTRSLSQLPAELVGAPVQDGSRWVPGTFGFLEGGGQEPPGQIVVALRCF